MLDDNRMDITRWCNARALRWRQGFLGQGNRGHDAVGRADDVDRASGWCPIVSKRLQASVDFLVTERSRKTWDITAYMTERRASEVELVPHAALHLPHRPVDVLEACDVRVVLFLSASYATLLHWQVS